MLKTGKDREETLEKTHLESPHGRLDRLSLVDRNLDVNHSWRHGDLHNGIVTLKDIKSGGEEVVRGQNKHVSHTTR